MKRHNHLKIGQYHQHLMELLDPEATPLQCVPSMSLLAGNGERVVSADTMLVRRVRRYTKCTHAGI